MTPNQSDDQGSEEWDPPGPGSWVLDASHGPPNPTPFFRRIAVENTAPAYRRVLAELGGALDTIDIAFVHGAMYRRLVPLVGARFDRGKVPPRPILWATCRALPAFRSRERTARRTITEQPQRAVIDGWYATERQQWIDRNLELQAVDPATLDDAGLAEHLRRLNSYIVSSWTRHHELHAYDLGPIGDMLSHANAWSLDPVDVMSLLRGSSPATTEARAHAERIAAALRAGGVDPSAVSDVATIRSVPAAAESLDSYLEIFGWRLIVSYDLEGQTLHELPSAICSIVRSAAEPHVETALDHEMEARLRSEAADPELFDELLDLARKAYGVRDDNGPLTWEWPAGLLRRAYLQAGTVLAGAGRLADASHVFELDVPELAAVLDGGSTPSAEAISNRARHRDWEATLDPPVYLGAPPAPDADLSALTPGLQRLMGAIVTAATLLEPEADHQLAPLQGLGIGEATYRGIARVADDPLRAIEELQPGEILVAPFTAPSYNAVLSIAGGLVVQEGGLLSHAAVMARELEISAVVGCVDAMTRIASGDTIEIDPAAGSVRVV